MCDDNGHLSQELLKGRMIKCFSIDTLMARETCGFTAMETCGFSARETCGFTALFDLFDLMTSSLSESPELQR